MPPPLSIAVVIPPPPRHGTAGQHRALLLARLLAAQGCAVTLVTEHLPADWTALAALRPGRPLPRCRSALPPAPFDWLLLAAPPRPDDALTAAALARAAGTRLGLLEPGPWPPGLLAGGPGLLLSDAAWPAPPPGWRQETWSPPPADPASAAPLLADILLRATEAVPPRPGPAAAPAGPDPGPPPWLRAAHRSSGGDLLLTLRSHWPALPSALRAHSPGGPALPLLWRAGPAEDGLVPVEAVILAPAGLEGHPVVLRATGAFGEARQRLLADSPPRPSAAAVCTVHEDCAADGWRLLRGEVQAAAPLAALRFSPDGERWLDATLPPPAEPGATPFVLEYRPDPQDDPRRARLLLLGEGPVALDLLVGWPPRPGRHQPGPAAFGIGSGLQAVVAGLAARLPGLRAVLADDPAVLAALAILPPESGIALLPFSEAEAAAWAGGPVLAGAVAAVPDPLLAAAAPVLALDGIGAAPALLSRAVAAALPLATAAGLRLAVVVDAPPLEPLPRLRARLGLPEDVLPIWPQGLAAAGPDTVRALADLGLDSGVPAAVALARGIPAGLWTDLAPEGISRAWPRLPLPAILALPPPAGAVPLEEDGSRKVGEGIPRTPSFF